MMNLIKQYATVAFRRTTAILSSLLCSISLAH